jgi:hypothetical protein
MTKYSRLVLLMVPLWGSTAFAVNDPYRHYHSRSRARDPLVVSPHEEPYPFHRPSWDQKWSSYDQHRYDKRPKKHPNN